MTDNRDAQGATDADGPLYTTCDSCDEMTYEIDADRYMVCDPCHRAGKCYSFGCSPDGRCDFFVMVDRTLYNELVEVAIQGYERWETDWSLYLDDGWARDIEEAASMRQTLADANETINRAVREVRDA